MNSKIINMLVRNIGSIGFVDNWRYYVIFCKYEKKFYVHLNILITNDILMHIYILKYGLNVSNESIEYIYNIICNIIP